ncbi:MAG: acetyl-CoA carboxylase biotin carboxyl carrier protein [Candidatus Omnitrophota bacterium]|nr:acetyl-CoA carboxylase biotin carboxyl carrier protein [Candidatus Omnitrophota bacterium]
MKPEELKPFVDFMKAHGLLTLSVEKPDFKLYLVKEGAETLVSTPTASARLARHSPAYAKATAGKLGEGGMLAAGLALEPVVNKNAVSVTSPLVGTLYLAPAPSAAPFVEVGQEVKAGDTLCVVEAMKVMNEIKSEVNGKVLEIKAENGKPVEFGQILFLISKP